MDDAGHAPSPPGGGKRRGGRPPVDSAQRRRPLSVRFSPAESDELTAAARAAGLPVSVYVRDRALGRPVRGPVPEVNRAAYAELARAAGNLNQLAAHANAGNVVDGAELRHVIEAVRDQVQTLRLALLGVPADAGTEGGA